MDVDRWRHEGHGLEDTPGPGAELNWHRKWGRTVLAQGAACTRPLTGSCSWQWPSQRVLDTVSCHGI